MEKMYRIVNEYTGEVSEISALPENKGHACHYAYKRACRMRRENKASGLMINKVFVYTLLTKEPTLLDF
jgi:hypothetical protein